MEVLRDLQEIYDLAANRFNQYKGNDFVLPEMFKDQVREINSNTIVYNEYSAIIETKGNQNGVLNIYLPNQWFYIASYFTDFYNELMKYKKEALKIVTKERLKDLNGQSLTENEKNKIMQSSLDDASKENLKRFITDYSWWHGAKTIDRGDFYVSPVLNGAKLVNASQSFVADLCAFIADKEDLVKIIISGNNHSTEIVKKELLREKAATTFMKKAMHITIDRDKDLTCIAALNLYEKTQKQLKINGFCLGRNKDMPPTRIDDIDDSIIWNYDSQKYVLYLEFTPKDMENLFFPVYNRAYSGSLQMLKEQNDEYVLYEVNETKQFNKNIKLESLQQIFYGAPGTGKSHKINEQTKGESVIRTTFHPDSDYSTFVGAYKPTTKSVELRDVSGHKIIEDGKEVKEDRIVYEFVAQAFLQAYVQAWKYYVKPMEDGSIKPQFLVIEEINRGNCAQIFGDLFQLLDRNKHGYSCYPIIADKDVQNFLVKEFNDISISSDIITEFDEYEGDIAADIKSGKVLVLPNNLYIWATMNTSDQSLFPIDSAFKRRWDWKYVPIDTNKENWTIKTAKKEYSWSSFLQKINNEIYETTHSEDKMLGFYFCKAVDNVVDADKFVNKVLFYIYNDVFKDYGFDREMFKGEDGTPMSFHSYYNLDGSINENLVEKFLDNLIKEENSTIPSEENVEQ